MLYVESPAGVGFSIGKDIKDRTHTDLSTSLDNLQALLNFYVKFPEYISHELYLSGESYAGIYVPYLAY